MTLLFPLLHVVMLARLIGNYAAASAQRTADQRTFATAHQATHHGSASR